jgi:hypothetical protein
MDFMERSRAILDDAPRASIQSIALLTPILKQTHSCKNCRELAFEQLLKFLNEILDPKIDEELEKVRILARPPPNVYLISARFLWS